MYEYSERMKRAMSLADKCWGKAMAVNPAFVEAYLQISEEFLIEKPLIMGDEFRERCRQKGLKRPSELHHNVWVSGPRALSQMGWCVATTKVEPAQRHNHMPMVTLWRSLIYGLKDAPVSAYQPSLFDKKRR